MARGDSVVVRAYRNRAHLRRVWEDDGEVVYITTAENFRKLSEGIGAPAPVGFHRHYVFVYDPATFPPEADGEIQEAAFWSQLQHY